VLEAAIAVSPEAMKSPARVVKSRFRYLLSLALRTKASPACGKVVVERVSASARFRSAERRRGAVTWCAQRMASFDVSAQTTATAELFPQVRDAFPVGRLRAPP